VTPSLSDSQFLRRRDVEAAMRKRFGFRPQLWYALKHYRAKDFAADLTAGTTVGIVAVPLAMAFAIASGVRPEAGLITAVVAGFLISALGGSRMQIGGPTGAFVLLVYTIQAKYGLGNLLICTMMAGVILIIMGVTRMGGMIRFIPLPVTTGFTSGIAVLIFSSQIRDFLGLRMETVPAEFVPRMAAFARHLATTSGMALAVAALSLAIVLWWPKRLAKFVPGSMAALVIGTAGVALLHLNVSTIGSAFGGIPTVLPSFHFPELRWSELQHLFPAATTIALLGAIESLLSAVGKALKAAALMAALARIATTTVTSGRTEPLPPSSSGGIPSSMPRCTSHGMASRAPTLMAIRTDDSARARWCGRTRSLSRARLRERSRPASPPVTSSTSSTLTPRHSSTSSSPVRSSGAFGSMSCTSSGSTDVMSTSPPRTPRRARRGSGAPSPAGRGGCRRR
jgi:hypothetical protein